MGDVMKNAFFSFILIGLSSLGACTSVPPLDFTVADVGRVAERKPAELGSLTVGFAPQAQSRKIESDHAVPPIWKEALQDAFDRSLIFTDDAPMKVNVSVRIVEANAPEFGAEMKTTVAAIYEIVDRSNGDIILSQEVRTQGIVPFDYAFVGTVRARESANRAVRNNIAEFLSILEKTDFSRPAFPIDAGS
jgi:hypothetical protein